MMNNVRFAGICILFCAGLVACGDDDEEPQGQAGSPQDAGLGGAAGSMGGTGGDGGATGGTGGTGGTDAGTGGMGGEDAGVPPAPPLPSSDECDILAQDCGDDVNTKCTISVATQAYSWCVPVWGDQAVGESCTRPTNTVGLDTCEAGAFCGNFGQPSPQERVCWALCAGAGDCSSGENCFKLGAGAGMGVCLPTCDPFGTDCNSANQCAMATSSDGEAVFGCYFLGAKQEGQSCTSADACVDGLWCSGGKCTAKCDDNHPCSGDAFCTPIINEAPHTGVCIPECDPFGTDCDSGSQCTWAQNSGGEIVFGCILVGTAQEGQSCTFIDECADGLWCANSQCRPKCDDDHPCSGDAVCNPVIEEAPHTGTCFAADWSCTGGAAWPAPVASEVDAEFTVLDAAQGTGDPVENATIKVCAAADPSCASPLATATTDAAGTAMITVQVGATGFDGYFEVTAQNRVPILRAFNRPLTAENYAPLTFGLGDQAWYQDHYAPSGVTIDFTRGHVETIMYDCADMRAPRVEIDATGLDASSVIAYLGNDFVLDESLTHTALSGVGNVLNVPGTTTTVTATRVSYSTAVAEATIPIRAGVFTELRLVPKP